MLFMSAIAYTDSLSMATFFIHSLSKPQVTTYNLFASNGSCVFPASTTPINRFQVQPKMVCIFCLVCNRRATMMSLWRAVGLAGEDGEKGGGDKGLSSGIMKALWVYPEPGRKNLIFTSPLYQNLFFFISVI